MQSAAFWESLPLNLLNLSWDLNTNIYAGGGQTPEYLKGWNFGILEFVFVQIRGEKSLGNFPLSRQSEKNNSGNTNTHNFQNERCCPGITAAVLRKQLLVRVSSSEINRNHVSICHGFKTPGGLGKPRKAAGLGAWKPWDPWPRSVWISNKPLQPPLSQDAWQAGKFWLELALQADCYRDAGQNKVKTRASKASLLLAQVESQAPLQPLVPGLLVQRAALELRALGARLPRQNRTAMPLQPVRTRREYFRFDRFAEKNFATFFFF